MAKRVLHYEIRIDDQPHSIPRGAVLHFERKPTQVTGLPPYVDAWCEVHTPDGWPTVPHGTEPMDVQIVGTGQPIPDSWRWLASTVDGHLVWHLYWVR